MHEYQALSRFKQPLESCVTLQIVLFKPGISLAALYFPFCTWSHGGAILSSLQGFEMIRGLILEGEPFSVENDLMTPTFKLKRHQLQVERPLICSPQAIHR